jgi:hypothetical protein
VALNWLFPYPLILLHPPCIPQVPPWAATLYLTPVAARTPERTRIQIGQPRDTDRFGSYRSGSRFAGYLAVGETTTIAVTVTAQDMLTTSTYAHLNPWVRIAVRKAATSKQTQHRSKIGA